MCVCDDQFIDHHEKDIKECVGWPIYWLSWEKQDGICRERQYILNAFTCVCLSDSLLMAMYGPTSNMDLHAFICISHNTDDDSKNIP